MVKYEREEQTFKNLREHYLKEDGATFLWAQIFHGWETEELRRLLGKSNKTAKALVAELDQLLDMIKQRRLI